MSVMPPSEDTKKDFPVERDGVAYAEELPLSFAMNSNATFTLLRLPEYLCEKGHGSHHQWIRFYPTAGNISWCVPCIIEALKKLDISTIVHT